MTAWDDVNVKNRDAEDVKKARKLELEYFEKLGVYTRVPKSHQLRTGGKIIGTRWVDVDKGDETERNYRSRLVGKEYNTYADDYLYAATPPLQALRLVISHAAI